MTIEELAMTREELEVKYPIGTKIRISNDIQKMKEDTQKFAWGWPTGKDQIAGSVCTVKKYGVTSGNVPFLRVKHEIYQSSFSLGLWSIHLNWIVEIIQDKPDDPDQLLKQQRDDIFASIFGG